MMTMLYGRKEYVVVVVVKVKLLTSPTGEKKKKKLYFFLSFYQYVFWNTHPLGSIRIANFRSSSYTKINAA